MTKNFFIFYSSLKIQKEPRLHEPRLSYILYCTTPVSIATPSLLMMYLPLGT